MKIQKETFSVFNENSITEKNNGVIIFLERKMF